MRLIRHDTDTPTLSGPAANERLTAWADAVLLVLLVAQGVTILALRPLLVPHIALGLLLTGPVGIKLASTGYRFARYHTGGRAYVLAGPPPDLLRLLAPFLVVATLFVLVTGLSLLFGSPAVREVLVFLHRTSFLVWLVIAGLHVLAHVWQVPKLIAADVAPSSGPSSRRGWMTRLAAVAAGVLFGVVVAGSLVQRAQPWVQLLQRQSER